MKSVWYVHRNGVVKGPYRGQELKAMALSGRLAKDDGLSQNQDGPWVNAANVKELVFLNAPTELKIELVVADEVDSITASTATVPSYSPPPAIPSAVINQPNYAPPPPLPVVNPSPIIYAPPPPPLPLINAPQLVRPTQAVSVPVLRKSTNQTLLTASNKPRVDTTSQAPQKGCLDNLATIVGGVLAIVFLLWKLSIFGERFFKDKKQQPAIKLIVPSLGYKLGVSVNEFPHR
jgi:hypothetical protein